MKTTNQKRASYSEEQIQEIIRRRESGEQINSIAADLGCHRNTVTYIIGKVNPGRKRRPYTRKKDPNSLKRVSLHIDKDVLDFVDDRYPNISELFNSFVRHLMSKSK